MPELKVTIGDRAFEVACQPGEEHFLQAAAKMLDDEAKVLVEQIGVVPEARLLLMSGLMLADKTASMQDRVAEMEALLAEKEAELAEIKARPAPEPERVEVPVIPSSVNEALADIAARAEAVADELEARATAVQ